MTFGEAILEMLGFMIGPLMTLVYLFIFVVVVWSWAARLEENYHIGWALVLGIVGILAILFGIALLIWMSANQVPAGSWEPILR